MASAEPRWRLAVDYESEPHHEDKKRRRKYRRKGRLESKSQTKNPADDGSSMTVVGLIGGMFLFMAIGAVFYRVW